jgi:hypothetical protein
MSDRSLVEMGERQRGAAGQYQQRRCEETKRPQSPPWSWSTLLEEMSSSFLWSAGNREPESRPDGFI